MKRVALLIGFATTMAYGQSVVTNEIRSQFAPSGTLRAGINYANPLLASRDEKTGELSGVAVDLSRELGRRLGVPVQLVGFDAAGKMTDAVKSGAWDIAFLGIDPARATEIANALRDIHACIDARDPVPGMEETASALDELVKGGAHVARRRARGAAGARARRCRLGASLANSARETKRARERAHARAHRHRTEPRPLRPLGLGHRAWPHLLVAIDVRNPRPRGGGGIPFMRRRRRLDPP